MPDHSRGTCRHGRLLEGTRSIEATSGSFPDNAWAVLRIAPDHSGEPVDDLYHWQGRWQRIITGTQLGDAIEAMLPFSEGSAVVRSQRDLSLDRTSYSLWFVSARNQQVLLGPQAETIRIAQHNGKLVAASIPDGLEFRSRRTETRIWLWSQPDRPAISRVVPVSHSENATLLGMEIDDKLHLRWLESETETKELTIELEEPFAESIQSPPWVQPKEEGPTLIEPSPGSNEPLRVTDEWKVRGRSFWLATAQNLDWTLFSDQPAKVVWNPKPISVRKPKESRCTSAK